MGARQMKILIVDDDSDYRTSLNEMLTMGGHNVIEASDGLEGLNTAVATGDLDIVMSDQNMPGMTGHDMFVELTRQGHPARRILMSSNLKGYAVDEAKNAGVEKCIDKSYIT